MKNHLFFSISIKILLLITVSINGGVFAQNIVPNHSFEITGVGAPGFPPWQNAGNGSADYFVPPTTSPTNNFGYQVAQDGNAYVGAFIGRTGGGTAENITAPLLSTMQNNHKYLVSIHVSLANRYRYAIDRIGVLFSTYMILAPGGANPHITATPSVTNANFNFITDTAGWTKLQWIYTANGGEQWINIGSFAPLGGNNFGNDTLSNPAGTSDRSYYYFDNICVLDLMGNPGNSQKKDTNICHFPATISNLTSGSGYLWSTGDTTEHISINTPGTYWVKSFDNCSFNIDTIIVTLTMPTQTTLVKDTFLCEGDQIALTTSLLGENYLWSTGSTNNTETFQNPGTYWVKHDLPNCRKHTDTFKVIKPNDPLLVISDTVICNQRDVHFATSAEYISRLWSTGETTRNITIKEDGTYWVSAVTKHNCITSDTFTVSLIDTRQNFADTVFCNNEKIDFTVQTKPGSATFFEWQDGSTEPFFRITQPGFYFVNAAKPPCSSFNQIVVTVDFCDCSFLIPTAFSPNGDGLNDNFGISIPQDCPIRGYNLRIVSRWGQPVFESNDINRKWDGFYNGRATEVGVYYYHLYFEKGTKSNSVTKRGDITLIR